MLWLLVLVVFSLLVKVPAHAAEAENPRRTKQFAIALVIYGLCLLIGTIEFSFRTDIPESTDFRQIYSGAMLARTDPSELYSANMQKQVQRAYASSAQTVLPFNHGPYEALLLAPLSKLSYRNAYLCFLMLNSLLLFPCFLLCQDVFSGPPTFGRPMPGWFFSFWPTSVALVQGQDSILLLLCLCLTYRFAKSSKLAASGFCLAIALFKPQLALPLAVFLTAYFGWRFLCGFGLGAAVTTAISLAVTGWSGMKSFLHLLLATASANSSLEFGDGDLGVHPAQMPNLRGLIFDVLGKSMSRQRLFAITLVLSLALTIWALRLLRKSLPQPLMFSLTVICVILTSYDMYIHDLVLLFIPMGLLVGRVIPPESKLIPLLYLSPIALILAGGQLMSLVALPVLGLLFYLAKGVGADGSRYRVAAAAQS